MPESCALRAWSQEAWVANVEAAADALGITPGDIAFYWGVISREDDEGVLVDIGAYRWAGADPAALAELAHPDAEGSIYDIPGRAPGTVAEEVQFGDKLVYRTWIDGAPVYHYFEDDLVVELMGPMGPGSSPNEAAVAAFFEALPPLVE